MNETTEVKDENEFSDSCDESVQSTSATQTNESYGTEHPFETTEDGYYIVSTPLKGATPDRLSITIEGTEYRLSEYMGTLSKSQFLPNTICYRSLKVVE